MEKTPVNIFLWFLGSFGAMLIFLYNLKVLRKKIWKSKSIMVILGSGGHTGEILIMISKLDFKLFTDCYFVCAHNDNNSFDKAKETIIREYYPKTNFHFIKIRRSRNVGQSFISSIPTTIISLLHAFWIILKTRPTIVVSHGPGVAVPLLFIGYFLKKCLVLSEFKILFVESFCRTSSISLSGKIVEKICDKFIVLWKSLEGGKREYIGKIL